MVSAAPLYCAAFVASPAFSASDGHHQRLAGVGVELLELGHLAVEPQLALLLVGDDVGRLFLQPPVLGLGLGERLLELHAWDRRDSRSSVELGRRGTSTISEES